MEYEGMVGMAVTGRPIMTQLIPFELNFFLQLVLLHIGSTSGGAAALVVGGIVGICMALKK